MPGDSGSGRAWMRTGAAGLLALVLPLSLLSAQQASHMYDRLQLSVSGADVLLGSKIRVDASDGSKGTDIDAEDLLGLDQSQFRLRGALRFRPGRRHELEVSYLQVRREAVVGIVSPIAFGDSVFNAGAIVASGLKTDQVNLTYRLALKASQKTQAGASLGAGAIFLDAALYALALLDTSTVDYFQERKFTGPTVSLGLFGRTELGRNLYLEGEGPGFYVKVSRLHATVVEGGAALRYFVVPWLGAEAGYSLGFYNVTLDPKTGSDALAGRVRYTVQTLRAGVVLAAH